MSGLILVSSNGHQISLCAGNDGHGGRVPGSRPLAADDKQRGSYLLRNCAVSCLTCSVQHNMSQVTFEV